VLNRGTPAGIEDAVKRSVDVLAPGGGFVFTQVHNIQPDVPPGNVVAMIDAFRKYAAY
jgi:uroporphyrinogen decarboxylase